MFEWILELEQKRVNLLNPQSMVTHQEDLIEHTLSIMTSNNELIEKWKAPFSVNFLVQSVINSRDEVAYLAMVLQLFNEVITRYVKMGVGEFLREFRRDFKLQKTEAHRKKVVEKKKKDLVSSKVTLQSMKEDNSTNKKVSHLRLQAMVNEKETIFQSTVYSKGEIVIVQSLWYSFQKERFQGKTVR